MAIYESSDKITNIESNSIKESIKNIFGSKREIHVLYSNDNSYQFTYIDNIHSQDCKLEVNIKLTLDEKGIESIKVISFNDNITEYDLEFYYLKEIYHKFTESLIKENERDYTVRIYYKIYHDTGFKGEYIINWKNKVKFKPLFNERIKNCISERIIAFDCEVRACSLSHARSKAYNTVKEFVAYLALLIDVGFHDFNSKFSHYIKKDGNYLVGEFQRNSFLDSELNIIVMDNMNGLRSVEDYNDIEISTYFSIDKIGDNSYEIENSYIENNSDYTNSKLDEIFKQHKIIKNKSVKNNYSDYISDWEKSSLNICIPRCIRNYYKNILKLDEKRYKIFRNCCRLYNISLTSGAYETTLMLAYMVSAVECLAKSESTAFSKFMEKYLGEEYDKSFCDFLYGNLRSGHFHSGEMFFTEYNLILDITLEKNYIRMKEIYIKGRYLMRKALIEWVKTNILEMDDE